MAKKVAQLKPPIRGYVLTEADRDRMLALNHKFTKTMVYVESRGHKWGKWKLRKGEVLAVIDGLRTFGKGVSGRRAMADAVDLVHSWGCTLFDLSSGLNSRDNGTRLMDLALRHDMSPKRAAELARLSHAAQAEKRPKQMPEREALKHWRNPNLTVEQALELMTGWAKSSAYKHLLARGVRSTGRPRRRNSKR